MEEDEVKRRAEDGCLYYMKPENHSGQPHPRGQAHIQVLTQSYSNPLPLPLLLPPPQ